MEAQQFMHPLDPTLNQRCARAPLSGAISLVVSRQTLDTVPPLNSTSMQVVARGSRSTEATDPCDLQPSHFRLVLTQLYLVLPRSAATKPGQNTKHACESDSNISNLSSSKKSARRSSLERCTGAVPCSPFSPLAAAGETSAAGRVADQKQAVCVELSRIVGHPCDSSSQ